MQIVGKLVPLSGVGIPLHDILPLFEGFQCLELLEEGDIPKDVVIDSVVNIVFL